MNDGHRVGVGKAEVSQNLSLPVDFAASADVNEDRSENDDPDGTVEGGNSPYIPIPTHPAPQDCIPIETALSWMVDENIRDGRDERDAVAE